MHVAVNNGLLLATRIGRLKDEGRLSPEHVSYGKFNNVRMATDVARRARALLGANGITLEYPGDAPPRQPRVGAHLRGNPPDPHAGPRPRADRATPRSPDASGAPRLRRVMVAAYHGRRCASRSTGRERRSDGSAAGAAVHRLRRRGDRRGDRREALRARPRGRARSRAAPTARRSPATACASSPRAALAVHRIDVAEDPAELAPSERRHRAAHGQEPGHRRGARAAGRRRRSRLAVACAQNGVANERAALRRFARTYSICVMLPATHLVPGVVVGALGAADRLARRRPLPGRRRRDGRGDRRGPHAMPASRRRRCPTSRAGSTRSCCATSATRCARCSAPRRRGARSCAAREAEAVAALAAAGIDYVPDEEYDAHHTSVVNVPAGRRRSARRGRASRAGVPASRPPTSTARSCSRGACTGCRRP